MNQPLPRFDRSGGSLSGRTVPRFANQFTVTTMLLVIVPSLTVIVCCCGA
ncbi:MAG TPA: hypothetical protein VND64_21840 [Pirellulales bacterium]|nr:hypothetical protein [Pirellulales bacterium]